MRYPVTTTGPTGSGLVEGGSLRPRGLRVKHVLVGGVKGWFASRGVERPGSGRSGPMQAFPPVLVPKDCPGVRPTSPGKLWGTGAALDRRSSPERGPRHVDIAFRGRSAAAWTERT